jgi:hypothetical protein
MSEAGYLLLTALVAVSCDLVPGVPKVLNVSRPTVLAVLAAAWIGGWVGVAIPGHPQLRVNLGGVVLAGAGLGLAVGRGRSDTGRAAAAFLPAAALAWALPTLLTAAPWTPPLYPLGPTVLAVAAAASLAGAARPAAAAALWGGQVYAGRGPTLGGAGFETAVAAAGLVVVAWGLAAVLRRRVPA